MIEYVSFEGLSHIKYHEPDELEKLPRSKPRGAFVTSLGNEAAWLPVKHIDSSITCHRAYRIKITTLLGEEASDFTSCGLMCRRSLSHQEQVLTVRMGLYRRRHSHAVRQGSDSDDVEHLRVMMWVYTCSQYHWHHSR
jgi:hypothetical protein